MHLCFYLYWLVFEKCSHRDGFPLHEEHPCPADNLLHLVEDAGKEGDRGEPVSSQPIMEEPEKACFGTFHENFTVVGISLLP